MNSAVCRTLVPVNGTLSLTTLMSVGLKICASGECPCTHDNAALLRLAGLAFLFSTGILLQLLGCVLYSNWWPLLTCLMYILVPMPCLFFGGGGSSDFISMSGNEDWEDAAKFLTGFSAVGSIAIPAILHHAGMITAGAMIFEFLAFAVLCLTVLLFQRASSEDDWS